MNAKVKKMLFSLSYRAAAAAVIFFILFGTKHIFPQIFERISEIWTKNTDFIKAAELLKTLISELLPV